MYRLDARAILLHRVQTLDEVRDWLDENPYRAVCDIKPDNGHYLIVYLKTVDEVESKKDKQAIKEQYPNHFS